MRIVFASREHVIMLEPPRKGLLGVTLRYPYEVRKEKDFFDDIPAEKIPKDMLDLAAPYRRDKGGPFQAAVLRGPLRGRAQGFDQAQAGRQDDRAGEGAESDQCRQPDGCAAQEPWAGGRRPPQKGSRALGDAPARPLQARTCSPPAQGGLIGDLSQSNKTNSPSNIRCIRCKRHAR